MKFKKIYLVSILLLAILTLGAASAAENVTADLAVEDAGDMGVPAGKEISTNGNSFDVVENNVTDKTDFKGEKLGVSQDDEKLSAGRVMPTYSWSVDLPKNAEGYGYVQYGQPILVSGDFDNATGSVTIRLAGKIVSTLDLVDGKFTCNISDYTLGTSPFVVLQVTYNGDSYYNSASLMSNVYMYLDDVVLENAYVGQDQYIYVNLHNATGYVNITFNNELYRGKLDNGKFVQKLEDYALGTNNVLFEYEGDENYNPLSRTLTFTGYAEKENATIYSSVYKTADKNMVIINIPYAKGNNVTVSINGKKEILKLKNGIAVYNLDVSEVVGDLNVSYDGDSRFNPISSYGFVDLSGGVVTNETFIYYFNQANHGKLFEFWEDGITLDFQGAVIYNPNENVFMNINKPINIISTTGDGLIQFNSAASLVDKYMDNCFYISNEGSGTNITNITFYNTLVQISNAKNIVFDNIKFYIVDNSKIGAGKGALTFRDNTTYSVLKNSYVYGKGVGSASVFTLSWADYCTFDNNTWVKNESFSAPLINFNYNNIAGISMNDRTKINCYNNFTNSLVYGINGVKLSLTTQTGTHNLFENNTIIGANLALGANSIYIGNIINDGELRVGAESIAYNNTASGIMSVGKESEVFNNHVGGLTLSGIDVLVHDNVINGTTTINAATNAQIYNNNFSDDNVIKFNNVNAKNITFSGNDVIGKIEFTNQNAKNNKIVNNTITTSADYAIDLRTWTNTENNISNNILYSKNGFGNDAVKHADDSTLILDNYQNTSAQISVEANDIKVGETAVINVVSNETTIKSVDIVVNGKKYTVSLSDGKGSLEVTDLLTGIYDVLVTSNDLTYGAQNTTAFEVTKNVYPEIVVDAPAKTQWIDSNITVTINDATGSVTLDINGSELTAEIVDGVAVFAVPDLAYGTYDFNITYSGDYKYYGNTTNGTLTVNKNKEVKIIASDVVVDVIADKFTAKFTNYIDEAIANANVSVVVGDETYSLVTDENGTVTADLVLNQGKYYVKVEFKAIDDEYDAISADYTITVIDKSTLKITSIDGEGIVTGLLVDALGNPIANASIVAKMNGVETNLTTDGDGLFKFQAKNDFEVSFEFAGDNTTTLSDTSITLNNVAHVLKDTSINLTNVSRVAVDTGTGEKGKAYTFTLSDAQGKAVVNKTVKVALNGKVYEAITNENGTASIVISLNAAKTYNLNVFFMGDDDYKGSTAAAKVTVTKKKTTLKAAKTKYSFKAKAKSKVIKATLKTSNKYLKVGKKVTIKIKGKTYTAKVGKKGVVKINIKKLTKKGTYKAKIKFAGDSTYKASSSKTIKIVIK